ncbi:MAG: ATP-binding protein [Gammaproteobacteria bacterium]|nr:ATP-binding protein [Gammaproteobacteria bacterium]
MIKRFFDDLSLYLQSNKALVIYGPRRSGKTTIVKNFLSGYSGKSKYVLGEDIFTHEVLSSQRIDRLVEFCSGYEIIAIDEAQHIPGIGLAIKMIVDNIPNIKIIATGSSSFDIANQVAEPLVGRKKVLKIYPISQYELSRNLNPFELKQRLDQYMIFGSYPEVLSLINPQDKIEYLRDLVGSYLYKDILSFFGLKKSTFLVKLSKMLAFQIGSEVSVHELATQLGVDSKTVLRYLELLESSFIIQPLTPLSSNLRKTINKKNKYYFVDNGVRNAIISQFNSLDNRDDHGMLFENFMVMERLKRNSQLFDYSNSYFWRSYAQEEIDYLEEKDGSYHGYEFKWSPNAKSKHQAFLRDYPNADCKIISRDNYLDFVW